MPNTLSLLHRVVFTFAALLVALAGSAVKANTKLPDDVQAFKLEAEAAFRSKDMAKVRTVFHPEYLTDGRNVDQQMEYLSTWVPVFVNWEMLVHGVTEEGPLVKLDAEYKTGFGNFPEQVYLKRIDGKWRFYGNRK